MSIWQLPHSNSLLKAVWEENAALRYLWKVTCYWVVSVPEVEGVKKDGEDLPWVSKGGRTGRKPLMLHLQALSFPRVISSMVSY